jgi:hypothetical protein
VVWPQAGSSYRLGYEVDRPVYLPAAQANGLTISLEFGVATLYAGAADAASHRPLVTLYGGTSYRVDGLADGEVLSLQGAEAFGYVLVPLDTTQPQPLSSRQVAWTCTGSPCPWASPISGQAIVWPQAATPSQQRLGYTTSEGIFLPATYANGMVLQLSSGVAYVYAGRPDAASHRLLATLTPGEGEYQVSGVGVGEVLSVQSSDAFRFAVRSADPAAPGNPSAPVDPNQPQSSAVVVWSCVGSPCPWGATLSGPALTWPQSLAPVSDRLGYSTSAGIYLPAANASGVTISVSSGSATAYAVRSDDLSYRILGTIDSGRPLTLAGLVAGELISVQSSETFAYQVTVGGPSTEPPPAGGGIHYSAVVVWSCVGLPCPWGATLSGPALTWPQSLGPVSERLGYSTSAGIYLPAAKASGVTISVSFGSATAYAVRSDDLSYRVLGTVDPGNPLTLAGLIVGELVSVQSSEAFAYQVTVGEPPAEPPSQGVVHSVPARWRCNSSDCYGGDWSSAVITWPAWSAYEDNARTGSSSRTVYSTNGALLYPYMGSWANGCEVTAVSGNVLIIEWQRGTDLWRETWITPGQTHTISLVAPEDGAMIETYDGWAPTFSVQLSNCTPQVIR